MPGFLDKIGELETAKIFGKIHKKRLINQKLCMIIKRLNRTKEYARIYKRYRIKSN